MSMFSVDLVANMGWLTRAIRPPDDIVPNENDPALVPPSSVGPDQLVNPGDPDGLVLVGDVGTTTPPPRILASQWSGWPSDWWAPWSGRVQTLTDTAWVCVDLNASVLSTMPPYLVNAAPSLDADWLTNPDPDLYFSIEEFLKQLFWDYQLGEAFVLATARYSTGWPARFHVVPPWMVNVEMDGGRRAYTIGEVDVSRDICHLRYQSTVDDAHGHGPLEAGAARLVAARVLSEYARGLAESGLIPSSVLYAPEEMNADQAALLRDQWVQQRIAYPGYPGVLTGGLKLEPTQLSPAEMGLHDLSTFNESRIAVMLGVPPFLVGLATGDSMTYANVTSLFDYHWRAGLRPKAEAVMSGLSGFLLPRGTSVELNRDEYVRPEPLQRAQTAEIYNRIQDADGNPVLSVDEIRRAERLNETSAGGLTP